MLAICAYAFPCEPCPYFSVLYAAALWPNLRVSCRRYIGRRRCSRLRGQSTAKLLMAQFPQVYLEGTSI